MKILFQTFLLLITLFISGRVDAQCTLPINAQGNYEYVEIVPLDSSYSISKIYNAALIAIATNFNNGNEVIEEKSESEGYIIGEFSVASEAFNLGAFISYFYFSIRLDIKQGRYKILINYLYHQAISSETSYSCPNPITSDHCGKELNIPKGQWNKQRCKANEDVMSMVVKLKSLIAENLNKKGW